MKKILSAILVFLLAFSLVGCLPNESDSSGNSSNGTESTANSTSSEPETSDTNSEDEIGDTFSEPETSDTSSEDGENSAPQNVDFDAQYIRSKTTHKDIPHPVVAVINSVQELSDDYHRTIKDVFSYHQHEIATPEFSYDNLEAFDKYNAEFFESRALVIVFIEVGSGSITHNIESVKIDADGIMHVNIRSNSPELVTCDLEWWHIVTEIPKDKAPESAADVVLYYDDTQLETLPLIPILND